MNKRFAFILMLLIFLTTAHAQSNRTNDPFTGVWKLNQQKSDTSVPAPPSVRIKADSQGISFTEEGGSGAVTVTAKFDGKDYPVKGSPVADSASYQRSGPRTIMSTVKEQGQTVLMETMTVSVDEKTLTVSFSQFAGVTVYDRQ